MVKCSSTHDALPRSAILTVIRSSVDGSYGALGGSGAGSPIAGAGRIGSSGIGIGGDGFDSACGSCAGAAPNCCESKDGPAARGAGVADLTPNALPVSVSAPVPFDEPAACDVLLGGAEPVEPPSLEILDMWKPILSITGLAP